ncbi:hypothetical protein, partial [Akkermansia sp.]|uniref:hypothetical protein n=1 Tax=Akkermansia sp. TaxID=1872421 RepID=UPI003AB41692
ILVMLFIIYNLNCLTFRARARAGCLNAFLFSAPHEVFFPEFLVESGVPENFASLRQSGF